MQVSNSRFVSLQSIIIRIEWARPAQSSSCSFETRLRRSKTRLSGLRMTGAVQLFICACHSLKQIRRFGPAVLSWKDCASPGDYIRRGILQAVGYHTVVGAALLFWSTISQPSPVSFVCHNLVSATVFLLTCISGDISFLLRYSWRSSFLSYHHHHILHLLDLYLFQVDLSTLPIHQICKQRSRPSPYFIPFFPLKSFTSTSNFCTSFSYF
jgi:hypothetical protein